MCQIAFDIPNRLMNEAGMDEKSMNAFCQQMLAVGLYKRERLSLGRCAVMAGMSESDFMDFLDNMGVELYGNMTSEDVAAEEEAIAAF